MPAPLSAIDAISPAFDRTKRELLQPFRIGFWLRMALVALATGEFYGSSGWGGIHFNMPSSRRILALQAGMAMPPVEVLKHYVPLLLLLVPLVFVFILLWIYISSVFRFVLFDSVLTDHCVIKDQWSRWRPQGMSFFLWRICFGLGVAVSLGLLAGAGFLAVFTSGALKNPRQHMVFLILGGIIAVLVLLAFIIAAALIAVFARDFVVPVMAIENVGVIEGWRRVLVMLAAEKNAYAGYVLMKIVLVVGSAILFGIITVVAVFLFFLPLSLAGVALYLFAKSEGLLWSFPAVAVAVILGAAALAAILYVIALISAPAMVFFQAYVIDFLGSRYAALGDRISPQPVPPTPAVPPSFPDASHSPAG
jgi:hypothetical protein